MTPDAAEEIAQAALALKRGCLYGEDCGRESGWSAFSIVRVHPVIQKTMGC
jgi:hypothetical protein